MIDNVVRLSTDAFKVCFSERNPNDDIEIATYKFAAVLYGSWAILRKWCREGLKETPEQIMECFDVFR